MTRAADARLLHKVRTGTARLPRDHVPTIDSLDELKAFMDGLKASGRMDNETREACLMRQQQLGER